MKSIAFFLLFLGLVYLSMARSSAFLDDLFVAPTIDDTPVSCNATDTCAGKGDACTGNYPGTAGCNATAGNCCASGLTCTVNKTCSANTEGESCNSITDCFPQSYFNCVNKTCQYWLSVGDECTDSSLCLNGNCANGTCAGQALNGKCGSDLDCNFGLYCSYQNVTNPTCQNTTAQGQTCTPLVPCYPGNVCFAKTYGNGTTCQQVGSQSAGGPCTAEACSSGLACYGPVTNMTCQSVSTSSVACSYQANCTGGACICSSVTGTSFCAGALYNPCTEESLNLVQCLAENSCVSFSMAPDSCAQSKCSSDFKKSNSCGCSLASSQYGKCAYNQYCGGFPVWAIIVIIVVAIVLVLAIVLLVFFMMRRRRQYDSI